MSSNLTVTSAADANNNLKFQDATSGQGNFILKASGATEFPTGSTVSFDAGSVVSFTNQTLQCDTITIPTASVLTLHSVPVSLVAAPGAGKAIIVESCLIEVTATSTAFAAGGVVAPVYHGATTALTANTLAAANINTGTPGTTYWNLVEAQTANGSPITANAGVDLYAATQDFTTGTGSLKVQIWYSVVTL